MDQRLRLIADLKNNASPEIKRIGKDLKEISRSPGMEQAQKWFTGFNESAREFTKGGATVGSVLSNIGVGGLTAAASMAGLVKSFQELATRTTDLKEISRQTGLTVNQVNQLQYAAEKLHIDPTRMTVGLDTLAGKMFDFGRHMGDLYGQLNQFDPQFAAKLNLDKPEQQIEDIVKWLAHIQDPQLQRRWTEAFLGDGGLSRLLTHDGRDFANALADAQRSASTISDEQQRQAEALYQATVDFNHAWTNFQNDVGPAVFKELKQAADDFKAVFDEIKGVFSWFEEHKGHVVEDGLKAADDAFAAKAKEVGDRWRDRISGLKEATDQKRGEDGNALHRNDETPAHGVTIIQGAPEPAGDGLTERRLGADRAKAAHGFLHKSSFEGDDDFRSMIQKASFSEASPAPIGASFNEIQEAIAGGTKTGFLAAMRELMAETDPSGLGGGGAGVLAAAYTTDGQGGAAGSQGGYGSRRSGQHAHAGSGSGGDWTSYRNPKMGESKDQAEREAYIREAARRNGIDPEIAMRVARSEGFNKYVGDQGTSFGDWQLHYKNNIPGLSNGGLGDEFTKQMKLDARNPATWRQQTDFALAYAAKHGWGSWHGARRAHVGNMQGIGVSPPEQHPLATVGSGQVEATDISGQSNYSHGQLDSVEGLIFHHTGRHGTPESVVQTLNQRHLGVQYVMDRDGKMYRTLPDGARGAHILRSEINGLNNSNSMGVEVIANDDKDVTPVQVESGKRFADILSKRYPGLQIFGHGEVNPSHKQASEGHAIVAAIRQGLGMPKLDPNFKPPPIPMGQRTLQGYAGRDTDPALEDRQDRARRPDLLGEAAKAGLGSVTHKFDGGAQIDIRLDGAPVKGVKSKPRGMIEAVNLKRGPTMTQPSYTS